MKPNIAIHIRHVQACDKSFWFTLDKHLSAEEFDKKIRDKQGYVLLADNQPIGILRYNLFWDNTPFCTLLFIKREYQKQGYGKKLMRYWENEMRTQGYDWVLVSTRLDESAKHFYSAIGYKDCGSLRVPDQPEELILSKDI